MPSLSIPPHRYLLQQSWMIILFVGVVILGSIQPQATAYADSGYAYYWSLSFDFDTGSGVLKVIAGKNDDGEVQDPPIVTQSFAVPCTRKGDASVSGGVLTLNGGYLACDLDLATALTKTFEACNAIEPGCSMEIQKYESYANFQALTRVWSTNSGPAPIFYHPNASYEMAPQTSMTQITASLTPHGVIPSSAQMVGAVINSWQTYQAFYSCEWVCQMKYTVSGDEYVPTAAAKVSFYTPATTIYIGYNPDTGLTAPAGTIIDYVFVDPPNHGND